MSRSGEITLNWADGSHLFRLPIKQLIELQEKCDAGPPLIQARLQSGAWKVEDVRETVRLGLIGGGMSPTDAFKMVLRYVDERPLLESVLVAEAVLSAALVGTPDEPFPNSEGGPTPQPPLPMEKSDGANTTAPASPVE